MSCAAHANGRGRLAAPLRQLSESHANNHAVAVQWAAGGKHVTTNLWPAAAMFRLAIPGPKWLQKRRLYKKNFYVDYDLRTMVQIRILAHEGACSRGTPEYGARSGVPRRRLVTVVSGGTGPRPPGTTTRTRGARCDRSGARRSASLGELPVREARDRSPKSPRWSAGRRASRVMGRKAPR